MDMFANQTTAVDSDIPEWIPPYQLTQDEREAILRPDLSHLDRHEGANAQDVISSDNRAYDSMCGSMSLMLRRNLGLLASFRIMGVNTDTYQKALTKLQGEYAYLPLIMPDNRLAGVFVLEAPLASALVEIACGGEISGSEISAFVFSRWNVALLQCLLEPLVEIWAEGAKIETIDSSPEFSQSLATGMQVDKIVFSTKFASVMGQCILLRIT